MSRRITLFILGFLSLLGVWEFFARSLPHLLFVLPTPSEIVLTLIEMRDRFSLHTLCTLKEMVGGFILALGAAFPLAWTMMRYQSSRSLLQPLFIVIQCLPMFTLAPIMVIWFGWSFTAIVIPTALMIFFPLTLNIYQGLRSTPKDLLEFFQTNQATRWQTLYKLRLPWALPHIFSGFRISAAIAGVGAVAGEWAGAQKGLGMLMLESRRNTDLEVTFGALFCLTLISTLLYVLILYCEKIVLAPRRWNPVPLPTLRSKQVNLRKRRLALPFFIFSLILFGLVGCQSSENKTTRLLLDWLPNPNHIPLYVGIEQEFFQEEGIDLVIQKIYDNGGGISYLTSGQADLLVNHMPGTLKACSRGADIKIVGLLIKEPLCGFIYRDDLTINIAEDLSGRTLGYCLGGPDTAFLDFLLEQGNVEPSGRKNVSVDLISPMGTKSVDFIYGGFWNIEPAQLRSLGIETGHFPIQDLGVPTYYEMIILANGDTLESSPSFVAAFQRALQKSIDFCLQNPDQAFEYYAHNNPDRRPKTLEWEKEAWALTYPILADNQSIDSELVNDFKLWLEEQNIITQPFTLNTIVSTQ